MKGDRIVFEETGEVRKPKVGELFLSKYDNMPMEAQTDNPSDGPRPIVRRLDQPQVHGGSVDGAVGVLKEIRDAITEVACAIRAKGSAALLSPGKMERRFDCPVCGKGIKAAEDGTCAGCGADVEIIDSRPAADPPAPGETGEPEGEHLTEFSRWKELHPAYAGVINPYAVAMLRDAWLAAARRFGRGQVIARGKVHGTSMMGENYADVVIRVWRNGPKQWTGFTGQDVLLISPGEGE